MKLAPKPHVATGTEYSQPYPLTGDRRRILVRTTAGDVTNADQGRMWHPLAEPLVPGGDPFALIVLHGDTVVSTGPARRRPQCDELELRRLGRRVRRVEVPDCGLGRVAFASDRRMLVLPDGLLGSWSRSPSPPSSPSGRCPEFGPIVRARPRDAGYSRPEIMSSPIVTTAAKIMCAHGGQVTLIPKQLKVLAGGQPVLCVGDLIGSPIVGCAQPPTPVTAPCLVVVSEIPIPMVGMSPTVLAGGKPVLLAGINGVTSGIPPSPLIVAFPGQIKAMA